MDYYINPQSLSAVFTVPGAVVDRYFKLAKAEHIKILLFVLKNMAQELDNVKIADECGVDEFDVKEALLYWADAGILLPKETFLNEVKTKKNPVVVRNEKPTRSDVLKRSLNDPKIQFLLGEAQVRFARNLKDNETRTLVWLYDDLGLDISVILLVIQYAVTKGKGNIRFIESVASDLVNKGIDNITDADAELHKLDMGNAAWAVVSSAFGLERRKPSQKETESSVKWINEWGITKELLEAAYDECVNQKSKFSFAYTAKIIENWHNEGYKTPEDVKKQSAKKEDDGSYAAYDLDLFEKMLNSKD